MKPTGRDKPELPHPHVLRPVHRRPPGAGYRGPMAVATIGSARVAPVFTPPTVPRLTEESLAAAGLASEPYTRMHLDLVRANSKGKWHAPGTRTDRCTHVTRMFGYQPTALPVQKVSVLGDHDLCSACARQVRLPGPAGVLHEAAGLIVAAAAWVTELERLAPAMGCWMWPGGRSGPRSGRPTRCPTCSPA